jgi:hypothetical protein
VTTSLTRIMAEEYKYNEGVNMRQPGRGQATGERGAMKSERRGLEAQTGA